jgi:hypothetical protein
MAGALPLMELKTCFTGVMYASYGVRGTADPRSTMAAEPLRGRRIVAASERRGRSVFITTVIVSIFL